MKKIKITVIAILLIAVGIFITLLVYQVDSDMFSESKHIQRIAIRIRKTYVNEQRAFTDFKIYPLYNEKEEMEFCLVEIEPSGFFCVQINKKSSLLPWRTGMYVTDTRDINESWQRARHRESIDGLKLYPESRWKAEETRPYLYTIYEVDSNGEYIFYTASPFKVANVLEERLYCFEKEGYCVFAIKQNDIFLNLVSMEEVTEDNIIRDSITTFNL